MTTYEYLTTEKLRKKVSTLSDKSLLMVETKIQNRIAALQKCVPWPALIQSLAVDLEIIWAEQTFRQKVKEHKADIEFGILNAGRLRPNIHDKR